MSDDDIRTSGPTDHVELAVAWVLHALDADQEAEFLAHLELEGCEECARAVAETAETLAVLALEVPQEDPPADLRYRLLAAAEAERPEPVAPPTADVPSLGAVLPIDGRTSRSANGDGVAPERDEPAPAVPTRRRRPLRRVLTAVAAAVAVVVIGGLVVSNQSLRSERDDQASTAAQYDRIVDVMRDAGAPGAVSAPLAAPGGALVGLVVDRGSGPEVLTTSLGPNESDQTYVLWAVAGAAPTPMGVFDVPDGGASVRSVPSSPAAGSVAGYAVSLEPGRSAPAAPTRIVASGLVGR